MNGNPMAGGPVTLYQSLYAWTPPCAPHGRCAQAPLARQPDLPPQSPPSTAVVTFLPASIPGLATNLVALAVTGNTSAVLIAVGNPELSGISLRPFRDIPRPFRHIGKHL